MDCTGKTAGVSCTGEPDGLLSADTGLMASEEGILTAAYLLRCALPSTDSIRIKDYTGGLVVLKGELGLTPAWKESSCNNACQEKVSACLMAFTNGDGVNVNIEMSAPFALGVGHSKDYPYQEAAFYGNLFSEQAEGFFCVGKDYADLGRTVSLLEVRACEGYNIEDGDCPYTYTGLCNAPPFGSSFGTVASSKCQWTGSRLDTAVSCTDSSWTWRSAGKRWAYPITTFRKVRE